MRKVVRRVSAVAVLLAAGVARAAGTAPPTCPAGTDWTRSTTDANGETTYTITAPCFVTFPADFLVTVSVSDPAFPLTWVAAMWSVVDTRLEPGNAATTLGSGRRIDTDVNGSFVQAFRDRYDTGTPVNHRIELAFTDLGHGTELAHGWGATLIGTVTYDPYPDSGRDAGPAPPDVAPPDPAAAVATPEPSGGCGSTGAVPALLGLSALLAVARPRRARA